VYVADAGKRTVLRYDSDGRLLNELAKKDDAKGVAGLLVPSPHLDVAVGAMVWFGSPIPAGINLRRILPMAGLSVHGASSAGAWMSSLAAAIRVTLRCCPTAAS